MKVFEIVYFLANLILHQFGFDSWALTSNTSSTCKMNIIKNRAKFSNLQFFLLWLKFIDDWSRNYQVNRVIKIPPPPFWTEYCDSEIWSENLVSEHLLKE